MTSRLSMSSAIEFVSGRWKLVISGVLLLLTIGAATANTVTKIRSIPDKMDSTITLLTAHDRSSQITNNEIIAELQATRRVHEQDLCLAVAHLQGERPVVALAHCLR